MFDTLALMLMLSASVGRRKKILAAEGEDHRCLKSFTSPLNPGGRYPGQGGTVELS
jgi:hypothetical protein